MSFPLRLGPQAVTTSNATLGAAIPTGQVARLRQIKITQPAGSDAKTVIVAIGTTATAANVIGQYTLVTGLNNVLEMPNIPMAAGDQINVIQSGGTTAQAVIEAGLEKDLIA